MAVSLRNKVVVITGASAGIGREAALQFAARGANLVVAARRRDRLEELARQVEAAGVRCLVVPTDVADPALVQRLLDATLEHYGRVDVWVNNAGYGMAATVEQTTAEEMLRLLQVNYMGAFYGCQAALKQMRRQGSGHVINVSSMVTRFPLPLNAAYTASKAALSGLSDALALELAGSGIYVSTVSPAVTQTEFTQAMVRKIPEAKRGAAPSVPAATVARAIVRCAEQRTPQVFVVPWGRLALAAADMFPGVWRAIARRYIHERTNGQGVTPPEETPV